MKIEVSGDSFFGGEEGKNLLSRLMRKACKNVGIDANNVADPEISGTSNCFYKCSMDVPKKDEEAVTQSFEQEVHEHLADPEAWVTFSRYEKDEGTDLYVHKHTLNKDALTAG